MVAATGSYWSMGSIQTMRHSRSWLAALLFGSGLAYSPADAETARTPASAPSAPAPPNSTLPQQTTASFGDWTLRCTRTAAAAQTCEVVQGISSQDRTVAQVALGRPSKGQPLQLTILVPASVTFGTTPALSLARDGEAPIMDLTWRRCLPGGCLADGAVSEDALRRVRGWTEPARVTFTDGTGRIVALPFSPRGLTQALDALAKDDAG